MKTLPLIFLIFFYCCFAGVSQNTIVITFGSCGHQDIDQPILKQVADTKPDFFIYLGDNIYGDSYDMQIMEEKYQKLGAKPEYQALQKSTKVLATWDDHDFGWNDSGRHYPFKMESKEIFLDFFKEPIDSERRKREGIYTSYMYNYNDRKLQIILLDTRTFRDNLRTYRGELHHQNRYFYPLDYYPHENTDSTLLGETQWKWLEQELSKPADVRIIGTSTQFAIEFNGYEAWANFPHEQKRMLNLIQKTKANGILFISGDVHYAEISKLIPEKGYPIYDFTSSGITSTWYFATPNVNRIEGPVMENHYGKITINWKSTDPEIQMEAIDLTGNIRFEHTVKLSELRF